jgi:hypothetical protein
LERRGSVLFPSAADFLVDRKWISLYRPLSSLLVWVLYVYVLSFPVHHWE